MKECIEQTFFLHPTLGWFMVVLGIDDHTPHIRIVKKFSAINRAR